MNTKQKILITSKALFNDLGYGAPTLNLLSQKVGISRGNLTYYFKDKEALLEALVDEMWVKYETSMTRTMQFPTWESTNNSTKAFHELQKEYAFIFFDMQVFYHPKVAKQLQRMKKDKINRQMSTISFSIQIGNMKKESIPGTYQNLCETLWMVTFYWLVSEHYREEKEKATWDKVIWSMILPHFTDRGIQSFINHFGEEYYNSLGDKYKDAITQAHNF